MKSTEAQSGVRPLEETHSVVRWNVARGHALGCRVVQANFPVEVTRQGRLRARACVELKGNLAMKRAGLVRTPEVEKYVH